MFLKKSKKIKTFGKIISITDNKLILSVENIKDYKKEQNIIATISKKEKSNLGKMVTVTDIIGYGKIIDISQNNITILSKSSNPIISKNIRKTIKPKTILDLKIIE